MKKTVKHNSKPWFVRFVLAFITVTLTAFSAQAHGTGSNRNSNLPLTSVACGDTITTSIKIANHLNCPTTEGFALSIKGDNIKVDGNGKSILAPISIAGLYAEGSNISIRNYKVTRVSNGSGLFAYDAPGLVVTQNNFSNNAVGITLYAEKTRMAHVKLASNNLSSNSQFGIRAGQNGSGSIVSPQISSNNIRESGNYAMRLQVTRFELNYSSNNDLQNSENGLYLKDGVFKLSNLSFSRERIKKATIFVDSAQYVEVKNVDVSSFITAKPSQERTGLGLYRVKKFRIRHLIAFNNDTGLKLGTEQGVSTSGSIRRSIFARNKVAGIAISSYDDTVYGKLDLDKNIFKLRGSALKILTSPGTLWTPI